MPKGIMRSLSHAQLLSNKKFFLKYLLYDAILNMRNSFYMAQMAGCDNYKTASRDHA
jgi:hypothetical protein